MRKMGSSRLQLVRTSQQGKVEDFYPFPDARMSRSWLVPVHPLNRAVGVCPRFAHSCTRSVPFVDSYALFVPGFRSGAAGCTHSEPLDNSITAEPATLGMITVAHISVCHAVLLSALTVHTVISRSSLM